MTNKEVIEYVQHTPYNTNPAILKQKLEQQDFENRADWNQNDPMAPDYVKNRTHYSEIGEITIIPEKEVTFIHMTYDSYSQSDGFPADGVELVAGEKYEVIFDGVKYECTAYEHEHGCIIGTYADEDEATFPFYVRFSLPDYDALFENTIYFGIPNPAETVTHTFEVARIDEVVHKLDAKYLPEPDLVITVSGTPDGVFGVATSSNTAVTKGTVNNVKSKILNGEIVDVRIHHIGNDDYMAITDEVKARAVFYNGEIFISWICASFYNKAYKNTVIFNESGEIRAIECYGIDFKLIE